MAIHRPEHDAGLFPVPVHEHEAAILALAVEQVADAVAGFLLAANHGHGVHDERPVHHPQAAIAGRADLEGRQAVLDLASLVDVPHARVEQGLVVGIGHHDPPVGQVGFGPVRFSLLASLASLLERGCGHFTAAGHAHGDVLGCIVQREHEVAAVLLGDAERTVQADDRAGANADLLASGVRLDGHLAIDHQTRGGAALSVGQDVIATRRPGDRGFAAGHERQRHARGSPGDQLGGGWGLALKDPQGIEERVGIRRPGRRGDTDVDPPVSVGVAPAEREDGGHVLANLADQVHRSRLRPLDLQGLDPPAHLVVVAFAQTQHDGPRLRSGFHPVAHRPVVGHRDGLKHRIGARRRLGEVHRVALAIQPLDERSGMRRGPFGLGRRGEGLLDQRAVGAPMRCADDRHPRSGQRLAVPFGAGQLQRDRGLEPAMRPAEVIQQLPFAADQRLLPVVGQAD